MFNFHDISNIIFIIYYSEEECDSTT